MRAGGPLIRLGTRFSSIDDLVARLAPFVTESTLVMPAVPDARVGTRGRFAVMLADKTEVMSGRCVVEEVRPAAGGGRTTMRLRLLGMDDASRALHGRLLAAKRAPAPPPLPPPVPRKPPPLRIVPAPTLIGVPFPEPRAAAAPTPIAEDRIEATERNRFLGVETRAPAAALTLPANPLSELQETDLSSFIECTLFESSGEPSPDEDPDDEPTVGPVELANAKTPAVEILPQRAAPPPAPPATPPMPEVIEAPARATTPLRRALVQAAPYALCTVIGVLVGGVLRGTPKPPPPAVAAQAARPAPAAAPAPAATPAPTPTPTPAKPAPVGPARAPAAAAAPACFATVTTEPPEAVVVWGERDLGRTPLQRAPVPCGDATVVLRHERYREVSRDVTAKPGDPLALSERLRRPPATLALSSSPARATFTVNGLPVGAGPRTVSVMRFEHLRVEASLPGYKPWSQTVYVKEPTARVAAQLVANAKPAAKPAPTFRR